MRRLDTPVAERRLPSASASRGAALRGPHRTLRAGVAGPHLVPQRDRRPADGGDLARVALQQCLRRPVAGGYEPFAMVPRSVPWICSCWRWGSPPDPVAHRLPRADPLRALPADSRFRRAINAVFGAAYTPQVGAGQPGSTRGWRCTYETQAGSREPAGWPRPFGGAPSPPVLPGGGSTAATHLLKREFHGGQPLPGGKSASSVSWPIAMARAGCGS